MNKLELRPKATTKYIPRVRTCAGKVYCRELQKKLEEMLAKNRKQKKKTKVVSPEEHFKQF